MFNNTILYIDVGYFSHPVHTKNTDFFTWSKRGIGMECCLWRLYWLPLKSLFQLVFHWWKTCHALTESINLRWQLKGLACCSCLLWCVQFSSNHLLNSHFITTGRGGAAWNADRCVTLKQSVPTKHPLCVDHFTPTPTPTHTQTVSLINQIKARTLQRYKGSHSGGKYWSMVLNYMYIKKD